MIKCVCDVCKQQVPLEALKIRADEKRYSALPSFYPAGDVCSACDALICKIYAEESAAMRDDFARRVRARVESELVQ